MLIDDYFCDVAKEVFERRMAELGATLDSSHVSPNSVLFTTENWFVEIFYLPEEGPAYCPRVAIGPLPELDVIVRNRQINILDVIPHAHQELRSYWRLWKYGTPDEMRRSFTRIRDDIFDNYVVPVLRDSVSLRSAVQNRSKEVNQEWESEVNNHNDGIYRRKGMKAFAEKDYQRFISEMSNIPRDRLSAVEAKKLEYARKQLE